jgi:carbon monoxide dehydrogenase subunit G
MTLYGCGDSTSDTQQIETPSTVGALNINVNPAAAKVIVTGPDNFKQSFSGNQLLTDLAPGQYSAAATAAKFGDANAQINVVAGQTSSLALVLQATPIPNEIPTLGLLNINVNPAAAKVIVTGPESYKQSFTGNQLLTDLVPGQYTASATAAKYGDGASQINVIAGETSIISLVLQATSIPTETPTVGSLNVNVNPAAAKVVVTGPASFSQNFTGNQLLIDLVPGQYTATATAADFRDAAGQINVVAGQTSIISLVLQETSITTKTVGSLNVNVNPAAASVIVTGPENFSQVFTGNQFLTDLVPGQYAAEATSPGFGDANSQINVVASQTSSISLLLQATPIVTEAPHVVYRNGQGSLISLDSTQVESGQFIFYAWLKDEPNGILTTNLMSSTVVSDPGKPLLSEQMESAPSFTQNLAAVWVGVMDEKGVVRPVIGADIRWEIDQWWTGRVNSMQFGTSDDNRIAQGYGVFDDQADTRTNNAHLEAERFPLIATEYPLFNQTGMGTPFADGFSWVTLFSPDATASARIVVVATINGEEIGKQILYKDFAPIPELEITKTVDLDIVNLINGKATVTWTIVIKNVGTGDATKVDLFDFLASGAGASYSLGTLPTGSTPEGDGFTLSFPLAAALAPGNTRTLTVKATVTEPGTYCNESQILAYNNATQTWTPLDLNAQACFTALESNISIVKDFVADDNTTSLGKSRTVPVNVPAKLRVRVINSGSGSATGVLVNDKLTSGTLAKYQMISVSPGTPNSSGGFDTNIGNLAAGITTTILFSVSASLDGEYCDTATVTATSGTIGIGSDRACLTVATPKLEITKSDAPDSVLPSGSYTSTIVVKNSGNATAKNVVISDTLGLNSEANIRAIYVSSSLNGVAGTMSSYVVTSSTIDIPAGVSVTFPVVSRIPFGAVSGNYCNTATATSSNATSPLPASDCVEVPAFSALQTGLMDLNDPIHVDSNATYFSTLYVEELSNEGVNSSKLTYSFGLVNPGVLGIPGVFKVVSTKIYLDSKPVRDPITGLVISDTSSPTALLLKEGNDYTIDNSTLGLQLVVMKAKVALQPNTALYLVHVVTVPSGTPINKMYTTSYIWTSFGLVDPTHTYQASSSEPTTVFQ